MAKFNSAREKNCSFRRAAEIYVDTFLTVPSALDLFLGFAYPCRNNWCTVMFS